MAVVKFREVVLEGDGCSSVKFEFCCLEALWMVGMFSFDDEGV